MSWESRIHTDEKILLGKPVIKGTRISVELILELFESGWTSEMILASYPNLVMDDLKAVFAYLRDCVQHELFFPISKAV
ncbi:MAG: DUF433 domain-containing protein [Bacteroidetes bacterium]|nr:DUF433 domain-containing protein [Bacteroidota bacterium]